MKKLEEILKEKVISSSSIGGGCIADSKKIKTESGKEYFVKSYLGAGNSILQNEANGLREIEKTGAIKAPHVIFTIKKFLFLNTSKPGKEKRTFPKFSGDSLQKCTNTPQTTLVFMKTIL